MVQPPGRRVCGDHIRARGMGASRSRSRGRAAAMANHFGGCRGGALLEPTRCGIGSLERACSAAPQAKTSPRGRLAAGWYERRLGNAIGFLVGALVLGTAVPIVIRALGTDPTVGNRDDCRFGGRALRWAGDAHRGTGWTPSRHGTARAVDDRTIVRKTIHSCLT